MSLGRHSTRETPGTSPGRGNLGRTRWGTGQLSLPVRQEIASAPQTSQGATRAAKKGPSAISHARCSPRCVSPCITVTSRLQLCGWVFVAEDPQPIPKHPVKGTAVPWPASVSGTCYVPGPVSDAGADSLVEGHTSAKSGKGDSMILTGSGVVREGSGVVREDLHLRL